MQPRYVSKTLASASTTAICASQTPLAGGNMTINGGSASGGVATLEIPAADVEVIARGKAQGEMQLALRSYADIGGAPGRGVASRASAQGVRVFRAGQVTEVANP